MQEILPTLHDDEQAQQAAKEAVVQETCTTLECLKNEIAISSFKTSKNATDEQKPSNKQETKE